ncbi:glycine receptor subunit alpha-1 [Plakobranchus ocellatus]|uniref:Glycine receptor subunit alpha-1 n=1 Tax=Plakobranchus ocellatus TaxID=259542 RepID=A0AAV4B4Y8_9GAST|nr:glycine receptor subunit alpha-1 [Plakobranchus ocellatus]
MNSKVRFCYAQVFAFTLNLLLGASESQLDKTISALLENGSYDPKIPPDYSSDYPVEVGVQIVILSMDSVDESSMDYSLTVYLRQKWQDSRLRFNPELYIGDHWQEAKNKTSIVTTASLGQNHESSSTAPSSVTHNGSYVDQSTEIPGDGKHIYNRLELDTRLMDKVWSPDTFFINERQAKFHEITVPNKLMHVFSNGTVFYSVRLSMTLTCHMTLSHYPFDHQECPLMLGSYGFTTHNLVYHWKDNNAVVIHGDVELPTFSITHWNMTRCHEFVDETLGNFSCLQVSVYLSRSYGYYVTQVYIPSILIVTLSWVNFWLDIDAIPARITLGLLSVLTMTTMSVGTRSDLPRVSYVKAIDVWTAVCLMFVFSALLEFAYVNVTARVEKRRMSMRDAVKLASANLRAMEDGKVEPRRPQAQPTVNKRERARRVDKISRIVFPSCFAAFNVFYWSFYMT